MKVRVIANWMVYDLDKKILKHKKERGGTFNPEDIKDERIRAELQPLVDFNLKTTGFKHLWYSYILDLKDEENQDVG